MHAKERDKGLAGFANSSDSTPELPNAKLHTVIGKGHLPPTLYLQAMRAIERGEEVLWNYDWKRTMPGGALARTEPAAAAAAEPDESGKRGRRWSSPSPAGSAAF